MKTMIEEEYWSVLKQLAEEYYELKHITRHGRLSMANIAAECGAPSERVAYNWYCNSINAVKTPTGWQARSLPMMIERRALAEEMEKCSPTNMAPKFEVPYQVMRRFYENIDKLP